MKRLFLTIAVAAAILASTGRSHAQDDGEVGGTSPQQAALVEKLQAADWQTGPTTVTVGSVAKLQLPEGFEYVGADGAQALMELYGNPPDSSLLGLVKPSDEASDWLVTFQFDDIGYVKDADKEAIDADGLLEGFREGIPSQNEARRSMGLSELRGLQWSDQPFYDPETKNLTWGLNAAFDDGDSINYDIRMLGRSGVMSATLIGSPEGYKAAVPQVKQVLSGFEFSEGNKYAEWKPGDKVAAYGLAGLIGGGALAVAAKSGLLAKLGLLFAKGGKVIILVIIAVLAGIGSIFKKIVGGRSASGGSY